MANERVRLAKALWLLRKQERANTERSIRLCDSKPATADYYGGVATGYGYATKIICALLQGREVPDIIDLINADGTHPEVAPEQDLLPEPAPECSVGSDA
jgi:hypothetical protein